MSHVARILLLTDQLTRRQRWTQALASTDSQVFPTPQQLADDVILDVLVTDRPAVDAASPSRNEALKQGELGVVAVGSQAAADVSLPADCTPGELRLACLLLAEIVRLRRSRRRQQHLGRVLSQLALSDALTGLPNRRAWDEQVMQGTAGVVGEGVCLALIDLDHFKHVNDQRGHHAGDEVLRHTGQALLDGIRHQDFVARLGGDEFALLITDVALADAPHVVERIRCQIGSRLQRAGYQVTASAGWIVACGDKLGEMGQLLAAADDALRQAKRQGRDRSCAGLLRG